MKFVKEDGKNIEGGKFMRGKDIEIDFDEKDRKKYRKITWRRSWIKRMIMITQQKLIR